MPSLNTILKLQASVRASAAQNRLFNRVKSENQKLRKEKASCSPDPSLASYPSFVNSFVSSFSSGASSTGSAAALDLKHGKGTGLTASEALSRVVATPSVHGPLRQSFQPLIDGSHPECSQGVIFVNPGGKTQETLAIVASTTSKRGNSDDRVASKRLVKDSRNALSSSPRHEAWKEKRWRPVGAEAKEEAFKRASVAEFNKDSVESESSSRGREVEHREDVARRRGARFQEPFENRVGLEMFHGLWNAEKEEAIGRASGRNRARIAGQAGMSSGMSSGIGVVGFQPSRNRLISVHIFNKSRAVPRMGGFIARDLHDVNLAGEGATLERPSDQNDTNERQSDQSSSDGNSWKLLSGACNLPHPDKVKTGGEDAYFICADKHVVGVADGVGGWADLGIDAGEYARELMSQVMLAVHEEPLGCVDPAQVMEKAHSLTKCRGSSTACILALTDSSLEAANLGDSGFVIVRNSRTVFKSPVQQHQFNIPFQLEKGGSDLPSAAQVFSLEVSVGDIIVAGTDGLFDNLYSSELTTLVVQAGRVGMAPQVTAQKIAALARSRAQDKNRQTPFSTAAQDAGFRFYGGKMDDITVIVSYITNSRTAAKRT